MKKTFYLLLGILFMMPAAQLMGQSSKTLHQLYTIDANCERLDLQFGPGEVVIQSTPGTRLLVEMSISTSIGPERLLDFLIGQGNYELTFERETDDIGKAILSSKKEHPIVMYRGERCEEKIKYVLFVPQSIDFISINGKSVEMPNAMK